MTKGRVSRERGIADLADEYDVIVVGAGPAGLSAATTLAGTKARTLLVDENQTPGGQIYRAITLAQPVDRQRLGEDYWRGRSIAEDFLRSEAEYAPATTAWSIQPLQGDAGRTIGHEVGLSSNGVARLIQARQVVLATGALERPFPIPGWTLPGVMTVGAAQIALKTSGLVPSGKVVIAGTGPLLYLLAAQLIEAGATVVGRSRHYAEEELASGLSPCSGFLVSPYLAKGLKLLANGAAPHPGHPMGFRLGGGRRGGTEGSRLEGWRPRASHGCGSPSAPPGRGPQRQFLECRRLRS